MVDEITNGWLGRYLGCMDKCQTVVRMVWMGECDDKG
jgi:hypothetical protein